MRIEEFKMERPGLIEVGDECRIVERSTVAFYYYIIQPALAMSGNYTLGQRIKSEKGIAREIKQDPRGFFVYVEFEN